MALAWDDFRLVKAIADRGGLTAAAVDLGINHSTAFRRLEAVETALGARLFERLRSGYVPTPAGAAMIAAAGQMEARVAEFGRAIVGAAQTISGELRVTAPASFVTDLMPPIIARFRRAYPAVKIELVVAEEVLNLSRRDADIAIRATRQPSASLFGRRLSGIAWAIYGPAEDRSEIGNRDWVVPSASVGGGMLVSSMREPPVPERIALRIDSVLGLTEAIEAGIGIGPLPCFSGDASPVLRRLGEPLPELESSLWLLTHPDLRHAGRVRAFMEVCAEAVTPLRRLLEGRIGDGR